MLMFKNDINAYATPIRVYEICLLAKEGKISRDEAKSLFCPMGKGEEMVTPSISVAVELGLLEENKTDIILTEEARQSDALESIDKFRRWCNKSALTNKDDVFTRISNVMLRLFDEPETRSSVGENFTVSEKLRSYLSTHANIETIPDKLRGWRFWASFLGLGLVHTYNNSNSFLPNLYVYLLDAVENAGIPDGDYTVGEFLEALRPSIDIVLPDKDRHIGMALANGLGSMHEKGIAKCRHEPDAKTYWYLPETLFMDIQSAISHIRLDRGAL